MKKLQKTVIKVTRLNGEKILIGVPQIITVERFENVDRYNKEDKLVKRTYTAIKLIEAMCTTEQVVETVEEIDNLINN
jgi:hypothetical protein